METQFRPISWSQALFFLWEKTWMQSYRVYTINIRIWWCRRHCYSFLNTAFLLGDYTLWWCDVYYSMWQFGSYEIPRSKHTLLVNTALRTVPCTITHTTLAKALHVYVNDSHHSSMRFWEPKSPNMDMWSSICLINSIVRIARRYNG